MFSAFYNLGKIINYINLLAVSSLLIMYIVSMFKDIKLPNEKDIYDYVKRCFIVTIIFMLSSWLTVSSLNEASMYKMYDTIAGGFGDIGILWFIIAILFLIVPFVTALMGKEHNDIKDAFNKFRNCSFIYGAICYILSFLLAIK